MSGRGGEILRGLVFYPLFYGWLFVGGVVLTPWALLSERRARQAVRFWVVGLRAILRLVGITVETRGAPPRGRALIAAKHQSLLDVFMLFEALEAPRFVMKQSLARMPIFGFFAKRVGAVPVDRGGGRQAARAMADALLKGPRANGQMVIYPQGTRVAPGAAAPYKAGVWTLYEESGLACAPAATNAGERLPRGLRVRPGRAVVAFLEPIPAGLSRGAFLAILEREIEVETEALARRD